MISGNPNDIGRFLAQATGTDEDGEESQFSFSRFIPTPAYMLPENNGNPFDNRWYDWRIENWGTKWEPDVQSVDSGDQYIHIVFLTAWTPPGSFLKNVSKTYPELLFECQYAEPGENIAGQLVVKGGELVDNVYSDEEKQELFHEMGYLTDDGEEE
jgi:hypothetical protein